MVGGVPLSTILLFSVGFGGGMGVPQEAPRGVCIPARPLLSASYCLKKGFRIGLMRLVSTALSSAKSFAFKEWVFTSFVQPRRRRAFTHHPYKMRASENFGPPGTPRNQRKNPVFGRPKIVKISTFWL